MESPRCAPWTRPLIVLSFSGLSAPAQGMLVNSTEGSLECGPMGEPLQATRKRPAETAIRKAQKQREWRLIGGADRPIEPPGLNAFECEASFTKTYTSNQSGQRAGQEVRSDPAAELHQNPQRRFG